MTCLHYLQSWGLDTLSSLGTPLLIGCQIRLVRPLLLVRAKARQLGVRPSRFLLVETARFQLDTGRVQRGDLSSLIVNNGSDSSSKKARIDGVSHKVPV